MLDSATRLPLPRAIATVSLSGTLREKLEAAAAIGFDAVEIFENDLLTFDGSPSDVRRIAADLGIAIVLYQPLRDFEAMPEPYRSRNFDRAERKFDVMQALGTDLVLVCSNTLPAAIDDDKRAGADLAELAARAAARRLRIGYEALAWGRHVNRWRQAWRIVLRADHPALGLILDSFHTLVVGDEPGGITAVPAEKLFFVQLADAPRLTMDPLSLSRHFRNFPGQGQLPVAEFLRAVYATGYCGHLSLEIFNNDFRAAPARATARDGLRSLIFGDAGAGALTLPEPPRFDGIEFIEFAVDEICGQQLGEFLRTLGFRHAGRHRSKCIELYRMGDANLILNLEAESAAAEHFRLHGPSVCALGLRVDDPSRAIARARAFGCQERQEPIGAGERCISAVRTPDGMLIKLVGPDPSDHSIYDDDFAWFQPVSSDDDAMRVDHVSQALPQGCMDSFVLFYRAILGLEPQPLWELADPYGLVQSRAMISREGSVRLSLNISDGQKTATGRFISASAGAGVHHIALVTDDIVATLHRLISRGARMLPIPANYYDDLAARHGLDDGRVAELASLNLLYDHDDSGEFLHAYTAAFHGRFFFEIVQRRDYCGFGAVNASVRIAAQVAAREAELSSPVAVL
jgi:4-hydroxyphenylpyruvate dioxygenase